jgi:hypothetical protein
MALGILRVCYVSWLHQDCFEHVSNITYSSSGGAKQATLGILCACYVSWLHQYWSGTPILVQPTDITRTQYTKCHL